MSNDLLRETQEAQVEAAEDAVVASLRRKGLLPGPCSPCGDGDTAMKYHGHDNNLRQFPARVGARTGIAIDLDRLRDLVHEFAVEQEPDADKRVGLDWTFEIFLQWLRKRQETTND